MRLIQVSGLIDITCFFTLRSGPTPTAVTARPRLAAASRPLSARGASSPEEGEEERQQDAQDDRGRQREIEREVVALDVEVAGQTEQRDAEHHYDAETGDDQANDDQRFAHISPPRERKGRREH